MAETNGTNELVAALHEARAAFFDLNALATAVQALIDCTPIAETDHNLVAATNLLVKTLDLTLAMACKTGDLALKGGAA